MFFFQRGLFIVFPYPERKEIDRLMETNKAKQEPIVKENNKKRHKKGRWLRFAVRLVAVILILELAAGALIYTSLPQKNAEGNAVRSDESTKSSSKSVIMNLAESTELVQEAKELKNDFQVLAAALTEQKVQDAVEARGKVMQDVADLRTVLDKPIWRTAAVVPKVKDEIVTAKELLQICEDADRELIGPYIELFSAYPLKDMRTEGGIRVDIIDEYLVFLEQRLPQLDDIFQRAKVLDLSLVDKEGKFDAIIQKGEELFAYTDRLPLVRAILGNGEDRLFILAAQNSSEMRSSGGFPGAIGTVTIEDGLLNVSNFISVWDAFVRKTPKEAKVTSLENDLFVNRMKVTWDADFCPDYERVASIWAMGYNAKNDVEVDGVISATTVVIQRLLSFLGTVTLSDGTELNGENATRILGHDLYYKYLGSEQDEDAEQYIDQLFAECAQKTFKLLISSFNITHLKDYFSFVKDGIEDRSFMIWLADEDEQELIREAGWDAGLNRDPEKPEVGVFFSSERASKMTWFLNIETEISDPFVNPNGSVCYDLTVTLSSVITEGDKQLASEYILGETDAITGLIYIFGPAGGSAEDFETNIDRFMLTTQYQDLDVGYMVVHVREDEPFVVKCLITTAPGVDAPIKVISPPTMEPYR